MICISLGQKGKSNKKRYVVTKYFKRKMKFKDQLSCPYNTLKDLSLFWLPE